MMKRISVIASAYNSEKYLERFLGSICRQSIFPEMELVICMNDPSEAEDKIIETFKAQYGERVKIIRTPRENVYSSWNRCVAAASSDLIAIWNVDDMRNEDGLLHQVEMLENMSELLFCYGDHTVVREAFTKRGRIVHLPQFSKDLFSKKMVAGPFFAFRKKACEKSGYFDEQFKAAGDFDLIARLSLNGEGRHCGKMLGYYYDGGEGLSTGKDFLHAERTAIEMRYGAFDVIDYNYVQCLKDYDISKLLEFGKWHKVSDHVPGYGGFIEERRFKLEKKGKIRFFMHKLKRSLGLQKLKRLLFGTKYPERSI